MKVCADRTFMANELGDWMMSKLGDDQSSTTRSPSGRIAMATADIGGLPSKPA